jgi:hypothetical protein
MYYSKTLPGRQQLVGKDFFEAKKLFDFSSFVHHEKRVRLQTKSDESFLADVTAAVVTQLHYRQWLKPKALKKALEHCHDILEDVGYRLTGLQTLHDQVKASNHHVIFVAGCQTRDLYESRVRAAFKLLKGVHVPFHIVFSGLHQKPQVGVEHRAKTPDEAGAMERYFDSLITHAPEFRRHTRFHVRLEKQSKSTESNVKGLMSLPGILKRGRTNRIFVVSSLFHLPRLSSTLEKYIHDNRRDYKIQLILVGAEDHQTVAAVCRDHRYVKNLFHQVFFHLLQLPSIKSPHEDIKKREVSAPKLPEKSSRR